MLFMKIKQRFGLIMLQTKFHMLDGIIKKQKQHGNFHLRILLKRLACKDFWEQLLVVRMSILFPQLIQTHYQEDT